MASVVQERKPTTRLTVTSEPEHRNLKVNIRLCDGLRLRLTIAEALRVATELVKAAAESRHQHAVDAVAGMVDALVSTKAEDTGPDGPDGERIVTGADGGHR